jgi:hypothetical protein
MDFVTLQPRRDPSTPGRYTAGSPLQMILLEDVHQTNLTVAHGLALRETNYLKENPGRATQRLAFCS